MLPQLGIFFCEFGTKTSCGNYKVNIHVLVFIEKPSCQICLWYLEVCCVQRCSSDLYVSVRLEVLTLDDCVL